MLFEGGESIALAIQGGAMRSIYCIGAVRALLLQHRLDGLKRLHVSSAGCVAGLLLTESGLDAERFEASASALLDMVATPQFINRRRIWRIVDVDFLVNSMFSVTKTSSESLRATGVQFEVSLTDSSGVPSYVDISHAANDEEVRAALIATMALPVAYPKHARVAGRPYFDGGVGDPLPVMRALEFPDCKLVYAVSSVSPGLLGREATPAEGRLLKFLPGVPDGLRYQMLTKNALGSLVDRVLDAGAFRDVTITRVAPAIGTDMGSRFNIDRVHLSKLEKMGFDDANAALARSDGGRAARSY